MLKSYNFSPIIKAFREIMPPPPLQLVLFVLLSLILYILVFFNLIEAALTSNDAALQASLNNQLLSYIATVNRIPYAGHLTVALVWAVAGVAIYVFIIGLIDTWIYFRSRAYLLQKSYAATGHYLLLGINEFRRCIWIFLLLVILMTIIRDLLPNLFSTFRDAFLSVTWWQLGFCVLVLAVGLYVVYISLWLAIRNPQIIGKKA